MSPRLSRLTAKQLIKKLKEHGYILYASEGSHQHFIHPQKPGKITIPVHSPKIRDRNWWYPSLKVLHQIFLTKIALPSRKQS